MFAITLCRDLLISFASIAGLLAHFICSRIFFVVVEPNVDASGFTAKDSIELRASTSLDDFRLELKMRLQFTGHIATSQDSSSNTVGDFSTSLDEPVIVRLQKASNE
jgi:hypothetical protein